MLILNRDGSEIQCPHCKESFSYQWENEYSDPEIGLHEVKCLACQKPFKIEVSLNFSVWG